MKAIFTITTLYHLYIKHTVCLTLSCQKRAQNHPKQLQVALQVSVVSDNIRTLERTKKLGTVFLQETADIICPGTADFAFSYREDNNQSHKTTTVQLLRPHTTTSHTDHSTCSRHKLPPAANFRNISNK